jgi:NADH-quinone oxidoreductase subunit N
VTFDKLSSLWPEICLFGVTCVIMLVGLSSSLRVRKLCSPLAALGLVAAAFLAWAAAAPGTTLLPNLPTYGKLLTCGVGLLLLLLLSGLPDRRYEALVATGRVRFSAAKTVRAEYYAFFLFSLTGLMLCAGATNLIWLFLALELTSLPTYVMVALSSQRERSLEAGVKYFFLGALGAAVFLFGFVMIYGGTGTVNIDEIAQSVRNQALEGGINAITLTGMLLAVVGLCFKIAAVPMHFYTPDVYQGAASPITAMLAFVPKAAGFFALLLLMAALGWGDLQGHGSLPSPIGEVLTVIAVLTMTFGNVLALLQTSVKRVLAYSSIAHSGYMLVALISGPGAMGNDSLTNGLAAIALYLLAYGVTNVAAFSVMATLEKPGADGTIDEADDFADIRGLRKRAPGLAWVMALAALGLMGFPPLFGFFAKLPLFTSGLAGGHVLLVIILGLNSAIAAYYYLRIVAFTLLESPDGAGRAESFAITPFANRTLAGYVAAGLVLAAPLAPLVDEVLDPVRAGQWGARYNPAGVSPTPRARELPEGAGASQRDGAALGDADAEPAAG